MTLGEYLKENNITNLKTRTGYKVRMVRGVKPDNSKAYVKKDEKIITISEKADYGRLTAMLCNDLDSISKFNNIEVVIK